MKTELLDIETQDTGWQKIDYRPFGEQSWTATDGVVRRGFGGDIFDIESGFIRMGARLYEPETGRFTSVDPLFEAFKRWSPYAYSYNSPLTFRDPTGLAPEKEKYKDEIQSILWQPIESIEINLAVMAENCIASRTLDGILGGGADWSVGSFTDSWGGWTHGGLGIMGGISMLLNGAFSGLLAFADPESSRGEYTSSNGSTRTGTLWTVYTRTSYGLFANHQVTISDGASDKYKLKEIMGKYLEGVIKILVAVPSFFDFTLWHPTSVVIELFGEIKYKSKDGIETAVVGLHKPRTNSSTIYFAAEAIMGDMKIPYYDGMGRRYEYAFYEIMAHEFAHAMHFAFAIIAGEDFGSYTYAMKEHFAISMENQVRNSYNTPFNYNPKPFFWRFDSKWRQYNKRGF